MTHHDPYWVDHTWRPDDRESAMAELHAATAKWLADNGVEKPTLHEEHFAFDTVARKAGARNADQLDELTPLSAHQAAAGTYVMGDVRTAFNAGYCYGVEDEASPEDLDCAWAIYQRRPDAIPDDWQDISTAPQPDLYDDSVCRYLLGIVPDKLDDEPTDWRSLVTVIWWEPNIRGGCWVSEGAEGIEPTHWKPISFGERP